MAKESSNKVQNKGLSELDGETLDSRLRAGHRLVLTRVKDQIVACTIEFFDEVVPLRLFNTYLANGMIEVPKDGIGYKISSEGKKRLK